MVTPTTLSPNKYFAFISYSSKDEKIVKWLHRSLENYRIPTSLASDNPHALTGLPGGKLPKHLRPVFWYKQDLSGTILSEALSSNLSDSRYLIVVCSPASAASKWVNDEVATFIAQGKEARIIPLIVAGTPNAANPAEECFPEALRQLGRDRELRGINLAAQGRQHALVDIIATMLGVRFDALWQRHKRRQRRRRILAGCFALLLTAIALGIYDYTRIRTEYYLDYADSYGIPQGISKIKREQVAEAGQAFRFSYSRTPFGQKGALRWRLDKVDYVNSSGAVSDQTPNTYPLFFPVIEYRYQEGVLAEIINKDRHGRTILRYAVKDDLDGNAAAIYDITGGELEQSAGYLSASTTPTDRSDDPNYNDIRSKIKRLHLVRDAAGRFTKITYHANNDDDLAASVTADQNGCYGQSVSRDSLGRVVRTTWLDEQGEATENFRGVASMTFSYASPRVIEFFNAAGDPVAGSQVVARIVMQCNAFGRVETMKYYDIAGKAVLSNDFIHGANFSYDARGFECSRTCFGIDGKPLVNKSGWAMLKEEHDSHGYITRVDYLDTAGKLVLSDKIYATVVQSYNSKGQVLHLRYYDTEGKPAYHPKNGDYGQRYSYDEDGYITRVEFLGSSGKPENSVVTNYAAIVYGYDKYHRATSMRYLDSDEHPARCQNMHAGVLRSYDSRGNETEVVYIGLDGRPTLTKWGVAILRRTYDARGNVTGMSYFGEDGSPIFYNGSYGERAEYNDRGQLIVKSYVDAEGKLMTGPDWWAFRRKEFDDKGRMLSVAYFGPDSLPVLEKNTLVAKTTYSYDKFGNSTRQYNYGMDGRPANCADGYHMLEARFDNNHNPVARRYFMADGRKALYRGQYHLDTIAYNSRGDIIMVAVYAQDGLPAEFHEKIHRLELDGDGRGLVIEERHYAVNGRLMRPSVPGQYAMVRRRFNEWGENVEERYYDDNGNPMNYRKDSEDEGYFRMLNSFDDRGRICRVDYFAPTDSLKPARYQTVVMNKFNQLMETAEFDGSGKARSLKTGSRNIYSYDKHSRPLSSKSFNADGSLLFWYKNGYDSLGRLESRHILNSDSALTVGQITGMTERYATQRLKYDRYGHVAEYSYFDASGKPMDAGNGYSIIRKSYDDHGRCTSIEVFDCQGRPCAVGTSGWHRENTTYNDRNMISRVEYFGTDGRPVNIPWTAERVSRIAKSYDEYGRLISSDNYIWENGRYVKSVPIGKASGTSAAKVSQLLGIVQSAGSFHDAGYSGSLYILRFDSWTIHDSIDAFGPILTATAQQPRRIVFIPLIVKNGQVTPGEVVDRVFPPGPLGLHMMDTTYDGISEFLEAAFKTVK